MSKSTARLETWNERWECEEALNNLDEILALVDSLGELIPARYGKEHASLFNQIAAKVGVAMQPHEARLDALLRGCA